MYEADQTTLEMANFPIEGNIIDHSWPFIVTRENGKPDHIAISLLAHLVYWYRPSFDPLTQQIGKKYKADLLQRSYAEIEDMLGLTKRETQAAFERLEKLGIINRILRTLDINGQKIPNNLFIQLNHKHLLSLREEFFKKCIPSYAKTYDVIRQKGLRHTPKRMTYTYNTTQNSTETSSLETNNNTRDADEIPEKELKPKEKAVAVEKKEIFFEEKIKYTTPSGKEKSVTPSEIYRHFLAFKFKTETVAEAIQIVKDKKEPVGNIFKLLEAVCFSIENNAKNNVKSDENKTYGYQKIPKRTDKAVRPTKEQLAEIGVII
jgi:DNA-binding Lrp family transcriptional regulator